MAISDEVHEAARLRSESTNFSIRPPRDDALAIWHELEAIAERVGAFVLLQSDSEQFFLIGHVPQTDLILAPHGKYLAEAGREADARDGVRHGSHEARGRSQADATLYRV